MREKEIITIKPSLIEGTLRWRFILECYQLEIKSNVSVLKRAGVLGSLALEVQAAVVWPEFRFSTRMVQALKQLSRLSTSKRFLFILRRKFFKD